MKTSFPVFIVILLAVPGFAQTAPYGPVSVVTASRTETGDAVAKKIGSELSNELTKSERVTVRIQPDGIVYRNPSQEDFIKAARAAKVPWLAIVRYQASDSENGAALVQVSHVKAESISSTATVLIVRVAKGVADVFNAALSIIQEVSGYKDVVVHLTIFVTPPTRSTISVPPGL